MTAEDIAEKVLSYMRKQGFEPADVRYTWYDGINAIISFKVKGRLKKWHFGMWVWLKEESAEMDFFCQHEENIDKFKPSRSFFCVSRKIDGNCKAEYELFRIPLMLKFIKRHPLVAFAMDWSEGYYPGSCLALCIKVKIANLTNHRFFGDY